MSSHQRTAIIRIAHLVSWIFNPAFLIFLFAFAAVFATPTLSETAKLGWSLALLAGALLGAGILLVAWARGFVIDADLATPINLGERSKILLAFLAIVLFFLIGSFQLGEPQPLHATFVTMLLLGLLIVFITNYWKISFHMLGVSILVTGLLLMYGWSWWPVLVAVPLVAWARLILHRHTPLQVLAGTMSGFCITAGIFWGYGLL